MTGTDESEHSATMFDGKRKFLAFAAMRDIITTVRMAPAPMPYRFPVGEAVALPESYRRDGVAKSLHSLFEATDTVGLLVIKEGAIRYENYWLNGGVSQPWISMSVAKSFVSAMVGMALEEGRIRDLDDDIVRYVTGLAGSGYEGVTIAQVLQMSSGVRWREDFGNPDSEISRMSLALGPGGSLNAFMRTLVRETEPGTVCQYSSADTQALGMLLRAVNGCPIAETMKARLCDPLGMESESYWIVDSEGTEMAFAGILMTARDFARLGELYRQGGAWQGHQIVPADYVARSVRVARPYLAPGRPLVAGHPFALGYGYQWWLAPGDRGDYSAIGVYNQYVYVDPSRHTVIVKLSANPAYGTSHRDEENKDPETILALREISDAVDQD